MITLKTDNGTLLMSADLFAFVDELERLKQEAEQRGGDLMLPLSQREANKASASAYTFCQIRLKAIVSLANVEVHTPAAGGAAPTQVEGGSDPEKSDSERAAGCGATPCSPFVFPGLVTSFLIVLRAVPKARISAPARPANAIR